MPLTKALYIGQVFFFVFLTEMVLLAYSCPLYTIELFSKIAGELAQMLFHFHDNVRDVWLFFFKRFYS